MTPAKFTPRWSRNSTLRNAVHSQMRDLASNDNEDQSSAAVRRRADDLASWAASRANEPSFARFTFRAAAEAQRMRAALGPRR